MQRSLKELETCPVDSCLRQKHKFDGRRWKYFQFSFTQTQIQAFISTDSYMKLRIPSSLLLKITTYICGWVEIY